MAGFSSSAGVIQDLTVQGGCVTLTNAATDFDLINNNASALSFDASGKTGILKIVTTSCSEGVKMSGYLDVECITTTGGLDITANGANLNVNTNGSLNLASSYGGGSAIVISAQCCGLAQVRINSTGTGSGLDAGGAAAAIRLCASNGGIRAVTGINEAGSIYIATNAGTSETIQIHSDQGTGTDSICIKSDAGGITLNPGTFVTVGGIADGEIRIMEDIGAGTNYAAIKVQNMSASYTLTLPADDGCCGEALTTNGSGTLDWTAISSVAAASAAEVVTGSATDVYVSPGRQHFHSSAAKGWVTDNTNSCSANASYNVSGVASGATGIQTVSWCEDFTGGFTYAVAGTSFDPPSVPHNAITCPVACTVIVHQRNNSHALADSVYGIVAYWPLA